MTTHDSFSFFAHFPIDIQRLIFEEAFEDSRRKAIHFVLVSREVRSWIEPLMYQCITLNRHTYTTSERRRFRLFASTFQERHKPKDFYTKYVQRLFIDDLQKWRLAEELLPLCSNLKSLACWAQPSATNQAILHSLLAPDTLSLPCLHRLSLYWESLPPEYRSFHHPIFKNLTHLDIDFRPEVSWAGLSSLQNLKYFNLDCISTCLKGPSIQEIAVQLETVIKIVIPQLPTKLQCFVILVPSMIIGHLMTNELCANYQAQQIYRDIVTGEYDPRIVLGSSPEVPESPSKEKEKQQFFVRHVVPVPYDLCAWTYLPRGRTDFWMEAKGIIENRLRRPKHHPDKKGEHGCAYFSSSEKVRSEKFA